MVYSRKEWVDRKLQVSRMPKVDWWLAAYLKTLPKPLYTPEMTPPPALPRGISTWLIHQTTSHGKSIGAPSYYMDYDRWNGTEADVFDKALTLEASVNARDHIGGTSPKQVEAAITRAHSRLEQLYA